MLLTPKDHSHVRYLEVNNHCLAVEQPYVELLHSDILPLADNGLPIVLPATPSGLPIGLIAASLHEDPLGGHTPALWAEYPFSLTLPTVSLDADGGVSASPALQIDPQAPHWSPDHGHRLFTLAGQPTAFVRGTMARLQRQAVMVERTQRLVALLHEAGALEPVYLDMPGMPAYVYDIQLTRLGERLDALDSDLGPLAFYFATLLHEAMAQLPLHPPPLLPRGSIPRLPTMPEGD